jgi:4-hydroxy-2-oxoheptanedioate aldolase
MRANPVLQAWREGKGTVGAWLSIPSAFNAELMSHLGFDWLCVDMQHGVIDYNDAVAMFTAIATTGATPFVRVNWNDPGTIMKVLDAGAMGVVIPLVNNRQDAERAVAACLYPPKGMRSAGPVRARLYSGDDYVAHANDEIVIAVMIETAEGLANIDEILSTPGVNACYVGPTDLSFALGLTPRGDNPDPKHQETVAKILEACKRHGVAGGIQCQGVEYANKWLDLGYQMVTLNTDARFLADKAGADLREVRAHAGVAQVRVEPR